MSKAPDKKPPAQAAKSKEAAKGPMKRTAAEGTLQTFMLEEAEDNRTMRIAAIVAIIAHAALLIVTFPSWSSGPAPEPEKPKVYVVQQVRFKPPHHHNDPRGGFSSWFPAVRQ